MGIVWGKSRGGEVKVKPPSLATWGLRYYLVMVKTIIEPNNLLYHVCTSASRQGLSAYNFNYFLKLGGLTAVSHYEKN